MNTRLPVCLLVPMLAWACGGDGGTGPSPTDGDRLVVLPGALLLTAPGTQATLRAARITEAGDTVEIDNAAWQTSQAGVVAVSADGIATAGSFGSAVITAQSGMLTSAPTLALVAEPAAGALLVADDQVVGDIVPVDPAAPYEHGWEYRVRLRGVTPAVGQVVLASGGATVGGRVVSVSPAGGDTDVVLALLPLTEMFENLSVNVQLPLANAPLADPALVRSAGAGLPGAPFQSAGRRIEQEFAIGNFECKAEIPPAFVFPLTVDVVDLSVDPQLTYDVVIEQSTIRRLVAHGSIGARFTANPLVTAALEAKAECLQTMRVIILPIGGPVALIIGGQVPVGVGFEVGAKATFGQLGFDAFYQSSLTTQFGIDCTAACTVVAEMTSSPPQGFFKPKLPSFADDLRFDLTGSAFGFAKLTIGNPRLRELRFETVELKAGLEQKFEFAGLTAQVNDAGYASAFALKPVLEFKTSSKLDAVASLLGITLAELAFAPDLPVISESPRGTFTITPATVAPGDGSTLGELATFTVTLDPVTYLGVYAVDKVEIRRHVASGTGIALEPGRPGCTDIAATSGQVTFTCQADFLEEHIGEQTFTAFVHSRIFGVPVPVPLEVAAVGQATVTVSESGFAITTTSLPNAALGESYSHTLQAAGGTGSVTWSIVGGQLPAGLALGSDGTISGTPTVGGTFSITVRAVSGGASAERLLTITVGQPVGELTWRFDADLEGWNCSSTSDCKWQLLTSNQFPQTSGWVALQDNGEAISRTLTLPANAASLLFEVSTHNVPGDVSRVRVEVAGVTVLDQTFTNPGSNTAFNFVPMSVDISSRAGQSVLIRISQQDDGNGDPTTLKVDNIRIVD